MFYADSVGLGKIRDRLDEMAARSKDDRLQPAPLLVRLADERRGFSALEEAKAARA
jgi:hypothetical protein